MNWLDRQKRIIPNIIGYNSRSSCTSIIYFMKMNEQDNFSINSLKEYSLVQFPKPTTLHNSSHKTSNLFESLISTDMIEKSPFDFESYRDNVFDFQAEEVDLLKLQEMLPNFSIQKKLSPNSLYACKKTNLQKQQNFSISEKSDEDESQYEALNRRKHKKPNRCVKGSTKNMLTIFKGIIQSYLRREKVQEQQQFLIEGYLNIKQLKWLITSSTLRSILYQMFSQRYLQRAIVSSSISLQHKMLYLKKIKKFEKWSTSVKPS